MCRETVQESHGVWEKALPHQFIKTENLFYGTMHTRNGKNQWANLICFNQNPRYIPMIELLSAIKPTQHLILPHV